MGNDLEFDPLTLRYKPKPAATEPALITRKVTGAVVTRRDQALRKQDAALKDGDPGLQWGSLKIPSWPVPNFAIFGLPGTGKTLTIRLLAQDLLPNVGSRSAKHPARCIVYDPKKDLLPHVKTCHAHSGVVVITNPLDERSRPWNIAIDFDRPAYAQELANLMVPLDSKDQSGDKSFYPKMVRAVLQGVIEAFTKLRPGKWTLRDLILATECGEDLQILFSHAVPHTKRALQELAKVRETYGNLRISVFEKLHPFRILASLWHQSPHPPFSLRDWMERPQTLVLSQPSDQRALVISMNQLLFNRAAQLVLSQPEFPPTATYFLLDELGRAEKLHELGNLLSEGRSRYISVILASQGIELLRHAFGEMPIEDLLSHCQNKAFLGLSQQTAVWAAQQIGRAEHVEEVRSVGTSHRPGEPSNNRTLQRKERFAVRPEEMMHQQKPSRELGTPLKGTYISDTYGIVANDEIPAEMLDELLRPAANHPDLLLRDYAEQDLEPWSKAERLAWGLKAVTAPPEAKDPFDTFIGYTFQPPGGASRSPE